MEWTARGPTQQRVEIVPPRASLDHVVNGCEALSRQSPAGIRRDLDRSENGKGKPIPPQGQICAPRGRDPSLPWTFPRKRR